jgi:hypothetical protein
VRILYEFACATFDEENIPVIYQSTGSLLDASAIGMANLKSCDFIQLRRYRLNIDLPTQSASISTLVQVGQNEGAHRRIGQSTPQSHVNVALAAATL